MRYNGQKQSNNTYSYVTAEGSLHCTNLNYHHNLNNGITTQNFQCLV